MTSSADVPHDKAGPHGEIAMDLLRAEAVQITAELIRIESVNTGQAHSIGDGETRVCQRIAELLAEVGISGELVESIPGRGSFIARLPGRRSDALVVHGHVDVVPVNAADWSIPPFSGEIRDGYLYGRGAVDMKDMLGMMVAIARHYRRHNIVPDRELIFAFFADEEAAGIHGAKWLCEHRPDLFAGATQALSEVGGFSLTVGNKRIYPVATAEKGVAWATITATGTAGHASLPTKDNPVASVISAVAAVLEQPREVHPSQTLTVLTAAMSELTGSTVTPATIHEHLDLFGHFAPVVSASLTDTVSPTVLDAGYKTNVIPNTATAQLDCRVIPGSHKNFCERTEAILGHDVTTEWICQAPIEAPARCAFVDQISDALNAVDPDGVVVPYLLPASTDNKHLATLGIDGYGFVPLKVPADFDVFGNFHAVDERVPVSAIEFGVEVLERLFRSC